MDRSINGTYEEYQDFVTRCIWRNITLIKALQLEVEDVMQELSIRLFRAIERYDSERGCPLSKFLYHELQHEMLNIKDRHKPHGITRIPRSERASFVFLDQSREDGTLVELPSDGDFDIIEIEEAISALPVDERAVVIRKIKGEPIRKKADRQLLAQAQASIMSYFLERTPEYA